MTIAVTGASGFVGSHLVRALQERTDEPIVAVVRSKEPALPSKVIRVDLDLAEANSDCFDRLGQPDCVVHLAWGGLPNYRSLHHFEIELPVQYRFLKTMVQSGLQRLLVTGTCYEYGMMNGELAEDRPLAPANPYAFAKAALLRQLQFLQEDSGFSMTWARLFYLWGEGQATGSLYPLLRSAAARGDAEFMMSYGDQLRDYLPITDAAQKLAALALTPGDHGIVNICSGRPVSVRAMVEQWIESFGLAIHPRLGAYPYPTHEPFAFWGNPAKLTGIVGSDDYMPR